MESTSRNGLPPLSDRVRESWRRSMPWPSNHQRDYAAQALAAERVAREHQEQQLADDLGVPKSKPRSLTDEETVLIVIWAMRGQR